jgi:hypothetical protein
MNNYFKHTNGEAFFLNGQDYIGFFHVIDGNAFTGKINNSNSEKLISKNNFISNFYLKKLEFDNQFKFIENTSPFFSNTFDIINKNEITNIFEQINYNNLIIFKSLVLQNPEIVNFDSNDCRFYGLSSSPIDMRNDDIMFTKSVISHIDPYRYSPEWQFLEEIKYSTFFVKSDQTFKYLCSTGFDIYIVKGSMESNSILEYIKIELNNNEELYNIDYDEIFNRILITVNDEIRAYKSENFIECDELVLIDIIKLGDLVTDDLTWDVDKEFSKTFSTYDSSTYNIDTNNSKSIRFGYNLRLNITDDNILFYNKYSKNLINVFKLSDYDISNILDVAMRNEDDFVCVLHTQNNENLITFFDPYNIEDSVKNYVISNLEKSDNYKLIFSKHDSNIFHINTEKQHQVRFISNPTHAAGQMKDFNLKYPDNVKFGDFFQKFGISVLKWNTKNLDSNNYVNIDSKIFSKKDKQYIILNNSGRLYCFKQNFSDTYYKAINLNVEKQYNDIKCSENSFGLFLNKNIANIIQDILTLYIKAKNSFIISENDVIMDIIKEVDYEFKNLYINGNETVNIISIQRIFTLLNDIQEKLKNTITS